MDGASGPMAAAVQQVHQRRCDRWRPSYGGGGPLPILMRDTGDDVSLGAQASGYRVERHGSVMRLPNGMSRVTGADGGWAFWLVALEWSHDSIDLGGYVAPYSNRGPNDPLPRYLRGSRGRACAARARVPSPPTVRIVDLVGELTNPYAVWLVQ